jgi:uncharacterized Ntn-hydrolase superfamily protein
MSKARRVSTFSIVACDAEAGELGVAVASKFLSVGAVVPFARGGVGAVATQAYANTTFGPAALALLSQGCKAQNALNGILAADDGHDERQVAVVDASGQSATFTGSKCPDWSGGRHGPSYAAQGNILSGPDVVDRMAESFESSAGALVDRLLLALAAGQEAGGDSRGQQSAALLIVREHGGYAGYNDRAVDLRVDDHERPIEELGRLLEIHKLYFFQTDPKDVMQIDEDLGREIQDIVRRSGHAVVATKTYDNATREAFRDLCGVENLENRWREGAEVDRVVMQYLRDRFPPAGASSS